jgi:hypothetical protein
MRPFLSFAITALALVGAVVMLGGSLYSQPGSAAQAAPDARDAYAHFVPVQGAPASGGTVAAGTKFTLDLLINAGTNRAPNGVTAAQNYMTFTSSVFQVVQPSASCSATPPVSTTLAPDQAMFESILQNETCNGPTPCNFRGAITEPGRMAYASGALANCAQGCEGDFRVASITLCAVAGGHGEVRFQFAPPAPATRDSEIVALNGELVHNVSQYQAYVLNVTGPTATPGPPTWTPTNTPRAGVQPTNTPGGGATCAFNLSDVPSGNEFYTYIRDLYCRNPKVITGFSDGTFRPYDPTKRSQLAKMLVLAFNIPTNTNGGPHFTDVPNNIEAYQYVETVFNRQIVSGFDNRLFKPWDQVKRGQVAKMVVLAAGVTINTQGGPHFSDVPTTNEFYQYIETARNHNMISGFSDGTFRPYDNAKRGQIAKIISTAR